MHQLLEGVYGENEGVIIIEEHTLKQKKLGEMYADNPMEIRMNSDFYMPMSYDPFRTSWNISNQSNYKRRR